MTIIIIGTIDGQSKIKNNMARRYVAGLFRPTPEGA